MPEVDLDYEDIKKSRDWFPALRFIFLNSSSMFLCFPCANPGVLIYNFWLSICFLCIKEIPRSM